MTTVRKSKKMQGQKSHEQKKFIDPIIIRVPQEYMQSKFFSYENQQPIVWHYQNTLQLLNKTQKKNSSTKFDLPYIKKSYEPIKRTYNDDDDKSNVNCSTKFDSDSAQKILTEEG